MACEEPQILLRCLDQAQSFEINTPPSKVDHLSQLIQQAQVQQRINLTKTLKEASNKTQLKRNIFQNTVVNKNAAHFLKKQQQQELIKQTDIYPQNRLEQEPFDDLLISPEERKIYEQLDKMGLRLADPAELQYNYYQKVRSDFFSHDEKQSTRFIERKRVLSPGEMASEGTNIHYSDCEIVKKGSDLRLAESNILVKRSKFKTAANQKTFHFDSSEER